MPVMGIMASSTRFIGTDEWNLHCLVILLAKSKAELMLENNMSLV
jgi:hypothetical protein